MVTYECRCGLACGEIFTDKQSFIRHVKRNHEDCGPFARVRVYYKNRGKQKGYKLTNVTKFIQIRMKKKVKGND